MGRFVSGLVAVVVVVIAALVLLWALGYVLQFLGIFLTGLASVLASLAWFLLIASVSCGVAYFLASVYRRP